ncbi:hypothetical protein AKJ45_02605 [candidate division MSBL1 archaeon SCGC-AAA261F19]|uniref:Probable GTP 3',8-cyclase n=1 Tax=candidate division MSBL1 archaeon SCGC-AAA261F19 TaxID=1698275 RepID=A0A133V9G5_9EURY|nr:hypothetical protein AKJ45_02605 [candidate division MSBL1 archaeon SCGC-AAA261F19]
MRDSYGRPVTGLRISVTNACDLDCFYCHGEGCQGGSREMTSEEIGNLVRFGSELGIKKVKLTGGEPLVRGDIEEIVSEVAQPSIVDVSMTTNGTQLTRKAEALGEAGLDRINVSLDSLDPQIYARIAGKSKLNQVLDGIDAALDADLWPVKLNMIILNGVNDDEVDRMIEYSLEKEVILQLIELLWTPETAEIYERYHRELSFIEQGLEKRASKVRTRWAMQARRKYVLDGGGEVEVVNPMHNSEFCNHCTRLRTTPDGYLKPCLMRNDNLVDFLTPLRSGDKDGVYKAFKEAIARREPYHRT